MHLLVVGVDHTTAPIAVRERLACSTRHIPQVLKIAQEAVSEAVLLSTCNRIELYAVCTDIDEVCPHVFSALGAGRAGTSAVGAIHRPLREEGAGRERSEAGQEVSEPVRGVSEFEKYCYQLTDEQAVAHLFGVAAGLHSLVPGEPQIQGQVAESLEIAQSGRYAGPILSALFRAALVTGKRARSETGISRNAASISYVAVQLAREIFPELNETRVLLVGSGKMSELAARNLYDNGARQLIIINRTLAHAVDLAQRLGVVHRSFTELTESLVEADVVISSTTAPRAIVTTELMQRVVQVRAGRPLLLIDIALPRDVEPAVADLPGVHLYNLDDLQAYVSDGIRLRLQEAEHVQAIIAQEVAAFTRWLRSLSVVSTISDLRRHADTIRQHELERTLRQLSPALSEREAAALQELTHRLVNKLLHTPTLRLKAAAAGGQGHIYAEAVRYLFDIEESTDETSDRRNASQQTGFNPGPAGHHTTAPALARPGDSH